MAKLKSKLKNKNVTITVDIDFPIANILDTGTLSSIGGALRQESIKAMNLGISPVTGKKFALYKNSEKYPKNAMKEYPDKKKTPVNLKLSGDLHNSLDFKKTSDTSFEFGILDPRGDVDKYASVHNEGERSDIAERRFIPTKKGEVFNRTIMLALKRIIVDRISRLLKK